MLCCRSSYYVPLIPVIPAPVPIEIKLGPITVDAPEHLTLCFIAAQPRSLPTPSLSDVVKAGSFRAALALARARARCCGCARPRCSHGAGQDRVRAHCKIQAVLPHESGVRNFDAADDCGMQGDHGLQGRLGKSRDRYSASSEAPEFGKDFFLDNNEDADENDDSPFNQISGALINHEKSQEVVQKKQRVDQMLGSLWIRRNAIATQKKPSTLKDDLQDGDASFFAGRKFYFVDYDMGEKRKRKAPSKHGSHHPWYA